MVAWANFNNRVHCARQLGYHVKEPMYRLPSAPPSPFPFPLSPFPVPLPPSLPPSLPPCLPPRLTHMLSKATSMRPKPMRSR